MIVVVLCSTILAAQSSKQVVRFGPDVNLPFSPAVKAGGFIFVSGAIATDDSGNVIKGDIKAQTKHLLDYLSALLKQAGTSLAQVASVNVYLKRASDFQAMNQVYRSYWSKDPPVRTTIEADLVRPDALIEIGMVAIPAGGERRVVHPSNWAASTNPYSYGIQSGDTLFLAGLVSRNGRDNSVVSGDIQVQTRTVLDNAGEILKAAGMTHADVVSSRVFITRMADFQAMNTAYRPYFPAKPPARATVVSGLMGPEHQIEITLTAIRGAREAVTTPAADGSAGKPNPNFSSAIRIGNRLYVAGMMGLTEANKSDMKGQTREALATIGRTMAAAGFEWRQVVDGVVYITDVSRFSEMNEAYREVFRSEFPARATLETGLVNADGLVEIMFTCVK
jgi:2-iminobutanoate/2-iminopropanoate deaminase